MESSPKKRRRSNSNQEKSCKSRKLNLDDIVPAQSMAIASKRRSLRNVENKKEMPPSEEALKQPSKNYEIESQPKQVQNELQDSIGKSNY